MPLETDYGLTTEAVDDLCTLYEPHPAWSERSRNEIIQLVEGRMKSSGFGRQIRIRWSPLHGC